ncbi:hypothetical protein DID88_005046 [Monilinia fructigena]|uniref:AMP-dependent synthetase/ligase domain-containing protein n=1 Tax=Monilinia fructigena TaxID=38457 RepID=A0A395IQT4_9HELO|nr:hypothetical protein DID88_005046 [Monilinia fructigena]
MASTLPKLSLFEAISSHDPKSTSVIHSVSGRRFTYGQLLHDVAERRHNLSNEAGPKGLEGERIAFLVENSYDYVVTLLSILGTQSIAVPLSPAFPAHELQYILDQSGASMLLSSSKFESKAQEVMSTVLEAKPKHVKLEKKLENLDLWKIVPTVYNRLLATHKDLPSEIQSAAKEGISPPNLRLSISGSAALPTPIKNAWSTLSSNNILLERYGMTEVGMALSCGLSPNDRVDGSVGWPLPTVQVRLVDTETNEVILPGAELDAAGKERDGEIQLRGPTIFKEYWRNPEATQKEHVDDPDGGGRWFKTGDVAVRRAIPTAGHSPQTWAQGPMYFIRGRKSGRHYQIRRGKGLRTRSRTRNAIPAQISECAVCAVPSGNWGQKVGAVVVLNQEYLAGKKFGPLGLRRALKDRLAGYKIPQIMRVVNHIPRNANGKD